MCNIFVQWQYGFQAYLIVLLRWKIYEKVPPGGIRTGDSKISDIRETDRMNRRGRFTDALRRRSNSRILKLENSYTLIGTPASALNILKRIDNGYNRLSVHFYEFCQLYLDSDWFQVGLYFNQYKIFEFSTFMKKSVESIFMAASKLIGIEHFCGN